MAQGVWASSGTGDVLVVSWQPILIVGPVEVTGYNEQDLRTGTIPNLFLCCTDDCIHAASCSHEELEQFSSFTNTFHPNLKFTSTISDTSLSFLDLSASISGNRLEIDIYFKPTDSHSYLDYTSSHPLSCKNAIPYSQFFSLRCVCSQDGAFHSQTSQMSSHFKDCNFPLLTSANLVYCIHCSQCGLLYSDETKCRLGDRFVENLRAVRDKRQHLPEADHFNPLSHSLGLMSILGLLQCHNDTTHKLKEQHL
eukprot:g38476.t1